MYSSKARFAQVKCERIFGPVGPVRISDFLGARNSFRAPICPCERHRKNLRCALRAAKPRLARESQRLRWGATDMRSNCQSGSGVHSADASSEKCIVISETPH